MSKPELKSLDDYQQFVTNTIKPWSREQRIALAAATKQFGIVLCSGHIIDRRHGTRTIDVKRKARLRHTRAERTISA